MSLKGRTLSILTLVFAIAAFGVAAFGQETPQTEGVQKDRHEGREWKHDGKGGMHKGMRRGGMFRALHGIELTDAQKQQIHSLMETNKPDEATITEMRTLGQAKREKTITPEQEARLKSLRDQAREKGRAVHEQMLSILTVEQKQQLEQRKQEMKERREQRRQMREQNKQAPDKPTDN